MKKLKIDIWGVIFWLGVITLFLWLLAKTLGLINTLLIIQLVPLISGLAVFLAGIKHAGRFIHRVENGFSDIKDLKDRVGKIESDVHSLDKRVSILEPAVLSIDKRVAIIESMI